MNKLVKVLLIASVVIVTAYGIYFILGRPPIPIPKFHYTVSQGNQLYEIVKSTESDQVTISWATDGEVEALADGVLLADVKYNMRSLGNTVDLMTKYLPEERSTFINNFSLRVFPRMIGGFLYHVVKLRITLIIQAI